MTQEEIIEGNKLISRFVSESPTAYNESGDFIPDVYGKRDAEATFYTWAGMEFHKSWNWLMPLVEKIEKTSFGEYQSFPVSIRQNYCAVYCAQSQKTDGLVFQSPIHQWPESKIAAVYDGVCAFIKWYNKFN